MEVHLRPKRTEFFYLIANTFINDEIRYNIAIFNRDIEEVHIFSQYFKDRMGDFTLRNKSINTIKNFHLPHIINFLNYIFNDATTPITDIKELKLSIVKEYLNNYSWRTLPNDNKESKKQWRSKDAVNRANYAISHFVYWLFWKKIPNTSTKMFPLKYIKKGDFHFSIVEKKYKKNKYSKKEKKVLDYIVIPDTTSRKTKNKKVTNLSEYGVSTLIDISNEVDPMMTFAIVLGAYSGLRCGYVCQMYQGRIKGLEYNKDFGAYLDFTYETILRSDNATTGQLKNKTEIPIYEGCTSAIYTYYQEHLKYLENKNLNHNIYGALFLDSNGNAMTTKTFRRRFKTIVDKFEETVYKEAALGKPEAIKEKQILSRGKVVFHSLRYYFKHLLEVCEGGNPYLIKLHMGHDSIFSQDSYGIATASKEGVRRCLDMIYISKK